MPTKTSGGLETFSTLLEGDQVERLRGEHQRRKQQNRRTSLADVARDVVERGLAAIGLPKPSESDASNAEQAA